MNYMSIPDGALRWSGSREEFIEFVMIVADFCICSHEKYSAINKQDFFSLCDALGNDLSVFFKVDISPHTCFTDFRKNTTIDNRFTKRIISLMKRLRDDEQFLLFLYEQKIMPSIEYISDETIKWNNAEKIATLLWLYISQR
ncbi:hypothetical protein [Chitinophaga sp. 212800010-3]|uniref:hypothetical protein n=1 Tax=unclassified Chitinophaga TaxID=2619133 RepID=UPI002DEE0764|nr:Inner membrane protein [Chitinophaga sp. 212800010-3]